jgi:hypothetical protein
VAHPPLSGLPWNRPSRALTERPSAPPSRSRARTCQCSESANMGMVTRWDLLYYYVLPQLELVHDRTFQVASGPACHGDSDWQDWRSLASPARPSICHSGCQWRCPRSWALLVVEARVASPDHSGWQCREAACRCLCVCLCDMPGRALGLTATSGFPASSDPGPRAAGRPGRQLGGSVWAVGRGAGSRSLRLSVSGGSLRLFPRPRGESWLAGGRGPEPEGPSRRSSPPGAPPGRAAT